jgi:hypothetical protein
MEVVDQSGYLLSVHFKLVHSSYVRVIFFSVHFSRNSKLTKTRTHLVQFPYLIAGETEMHKREETCLGSPNYLTTDKTKKEVS